MKRISFLSSLFLLGFLVGLCPAAEIILFGPAQYLRTSGEPDSYTESFPGIVGDASLIIVNGDPEGNNRSSSAVVWLNGEKIAEPKHFNPQMDNILLPVTLSEINSIEIELRSKPGTYITIFITKEVDLMQGAIPPPIEIPETYETVYTIEDGTTVPLTAIQQRVFVHFYPGISLNTAERTILDLGGSIISRIPSTNLYLVEVPVGAEMDFIDLMRQAPNVLIVQPDIPVSGSLLPDPTEWKEVSADPDFSWYHTEINAPLAWEAVEKLPATPKQIGIVDVGFLGISKAAELDFAGRIVGGLPPLPGGGEHGTLMAALAAATRNNKGNVGVNAAAKINFERAFTLFDVQYQLSEAVGAGARVINLSLGGISTKRGPAQYAPCLIFTSSYLRPLFSYIENSLNILVELSQQTNKRFIVVQAAHQNEDGLEGCELGANIKFGKPKNLILVGASQRDRGRWPPRLLIPS